MITPYFFLIVAAVFLVHGLVALVRGRVWARGGMRERRLDPMEFWFAVVASLATGLGLLYVSRAALASLLGG